MYLLNFLYFNKLFKKLPQSFYIAKSQRSYGVLHSVRASLIPPIEDLVSPPLMLTLYYYLAKIHPGT